jgi:hypothetical protein
MVEFLGNQLLGELISSGMEVFMGLGCHIWTRTPFIPFRNEIVDSRLCDMSLEDRSSVEHWVWSYPQAMLKDISSAALKI